MSESLPDLAELLPSWQLSLEAENKSKSTVSGYGWSARVFLKWCTEQGNYPVLDKPTVQKFLASILAGGGEPTTARTRYAALRRYGAWLADEGELDSNPLADMRPPRLDSKVVEALSDDQLRALIRACEGKSFLDKRDTAAVRFLAETGVRAGEFVAMLTTDVDLTRGMGTVRKGKGGKGRFVPFGAQTASALDRYIRARKSHRLASSPQLWLGGGGQSFGYSGLDRAMKARASAAGIENFHLHLLRSTAATRWLGAGGSEQGLMSVAGWSTRSMLDRYTSASAAERAAAEARNLDLGNL